MLYLLSKKLDACVPSERRRNSSRTDPHHITRKVDLVVFRLAQSDLASMKH